MKVGLSSPPVNCVEMFKHIGFITKNKYSETYIIFGEYETL